MLFGPAVYISCSHPPLLMETLKLIIALYIVHTYMWNTPLHLVDSIYAIQIWHAPMNALRCRPAIRHFHQFGRCGNQTDVYFVSNISGACRVTANQRLHYPSVFCADPFRRANLYSTLHACHLAPEVFSQLLYTDYVTRFEACGFGLCAFRRCDIPCVWRSQEAESSSVRAR